MLEELKKVLAGIRRDTQKLLDNTLKSYLQIARYDVTTAPNGTVIGVTRPFSDTEIQIPYLPYCANAAVGNTVLVVWWGSLTNAQAWFKLPADPGILNFRPGGLGAAFGKAAEEDNRLDVAWDERVRGDLTVDGATIMEKGSRVYATNVGSGNAGYVKLAVITITDSYANSPISITICQRRLAIPTTVYLRFASVGSTATYVEALYGSGPGISQIWVYHPSASVFELWVRRTAWDWVEVIDYHLPRYLKNGVNIEWTAEYSSTEPTGTQPTPIYAPIKTASHTSASFSVSAGGTGNITINCAETGYTLLGVIGITGSGSTGLSYSDYYVDGTNNIRIYYRNNQSENKSSVTLTVTCIYAMA